MSFWDTQEKETANTSAGAHALRAAHDGACRRGRGQWRAGGDGCDNKNKCTIDRRHQSVSRLIIVQDRLHARPFAGQVGALGMAWGMEMSTAPSGGSGRWPGGRPLRGGGISGKGSRLPAPPREAPAGAALLATASRASQRHLSRPHAPRTPHAPPP